MDDFFAKDDYTQDDISGLIEMKAEESINLEFKSAESLGNQPERKKELSKDVSAFANSDGGIIVYGIRESNHVAEELSFVDGTTFTKEWLEQVLNTRISRRIPNLTIHPVRFDSDVSKSVYIVKIPTSPFAPHMASDKRFYKRYNFESVALEEYEVRDIYDRRQRTELRIIDLLYNAAGSGSSGRTLTSVDFRIRFQIENIGNSIEDSYKLQVHIPRQLHMNNVDNSILKYLMRENEAELVFSIPSQSPIFQNEQTTVIDALIGVKSNSFRFLQDPGIQTVLYFSSGKVSRNFNLLEILTHEDQTLDNYFGA